MRYSKVSVLMPVYNTKEEYLREAIKSMMIACTQIIRDKILNFLTEDEKLRKKLHDCNKLKVIFPTKNSTKKLYLFHFFPIFKIKQNKIKYYLFHFIPKLKVKKNDT